MSKKLQFPKGIMNVELLFQQTPWQRAGMHCHASVKGTFLSESTDVFVITPNRRTFFFPETENLNFGDF